MGIVSLSILPVVNLPHQSSYSYSNHLFQYLPHRTLDHHQVYHLHTLRKLSSLISVSCRTLFCLLDIASHTLAAIHLSSSPLIFTMVTSISAFATGASPALQSLAICILRVQRSQPGSPDTGALFGGLSMLTALRHILAVSPSFTLHTLFPYPVLTVLCLVAACSRSFLAWST